MEINNKDCNILIIGYLNAQVENEPVPNIIGTFTEATRNRNGEVLREYASYVKLKVMKTFSVKRKFTNKHEQHVVVDH